jgi:hypothetical protein
MAETTLIGEATVAASASCDVVAYGKTDADEDVTFVVSCDNAYTVAFYAADADFSAISDAGVLCEETRSGVAATSGDGNAYIIDTGHKAYVACVVTNDGGDAATVTVKANESVAPVAAAELYYMHALAKRVGMEAMSSSLAADRANLGVM